MASSSKKSLTGMNIEEYSEKAILLKGDTKPYKEDIKVLGGKWNSGLGGWIFPKTKRQAVEEFISSGKRLVSKEDLIAAEARDKAYAEERKSSSFTGTKQSSSSNTDEKLAVLEKKIDRLTAMFGDLQALVKKSHNEEVGEVVVESDEEEDEKPQPRLMKSKK